MGNLFELKEVSSEKPNHLKVTFTSFHVDARSPIVDELLAAMRTSYAMISIGFPEAERFRIVIPKERLLKISISTQPKAGGIVPCYKAACASFKQDPHPSLLKFFDSELSQPTPSQVLDLSGCPNISQLDKKPIDLRPLAYALRFNTHYTTLAIRTCLRRDAAAVFGETLIHNSTLEVLQLVSVDLSDTSKLAEALARNNSIALKDLDLSHSNLGDKKVTAIIKALYNFRTLRSLRIAKTDIGAKSIAALNALVETQKALAATIEEISVSHNDLSSSSGKELLKLIDALRFIPDSSLTTLGVAGTRIDLEKLVAAVSQLPKLAAIDLARTKIDKRGSNALLQWFNGSSTLKAVTLVGSDVSADNFKLILSALTGNPKITDLELNLSSIDLSGQHGTALNVALSSSTAVGNLAHLVLKSCKLKPDTIISLAHALSKHQPNLRSLNLNNNVRRKADSYQIGVAIANLVAAAKSLDSLRIAGDGSEFALGQSIQPILDYIPRGNLLELDISNNNMCDGKNNTVMDSLCQAIDKSKTLTSLRWDGNGTNFAGFTAFSTALASNKSIASMPFPVRDFRKAIKDAVAKAPKKERAGVADTIKRVFASIVTSLKRNSGLLKKDAKRTGRLNAASKAGNVDSSAPPPIPAGDTARMSLYEPTLLLEFAPDNDDHKPSNRVDFEVNEAGRKVRGASASGSKRATPGSSAVPDLAAAASKALAKGPSRSDKPTKASATPGKASNPPSRNASPMKGGSKRAPPAGRSSKGSKGSKGSRRGKKPAGEAVNGWDEGAAEEERKVRFK